MSTAFTQANAYLSLSTPLGPDVLLLRALSGEERLSAPFLFHLELLSENGAVDFTQVVGKPATVTVALFDGTNRYIHGIITRFAQAGRDARFTEYHAELRPWLWLLTLTTDSQIFQQKTAPDIITQVFTDLGFTDYRNDCSGTYVTRDYCVQYQETAFDFVSRLMEDEGIFYSFEHGDGVHTLVMADATTAHTACAGLATVSYSQSARSDADVDTVTDCVLEQQVTTAKHTLKDYNFEVPSTDLKVQAAGDGTLNVYEYPGGYTVTGDGETKAGVRLAAHEWPAKLLRGNSNCRPFVAGGKFTLSNHDRADINGDWVLASVVHSARHDAYANAFEAFPAATPFRPPRVTRRPVIAGTQTAVVVGASGEEIYTDKYGRVKVQFHWDLKGTKDENSSCWIRVDQGWAGKKWGAIFLPRIGQEVIVSFLEGDPDRPLVTGAIYNADLMPPYDLPANMTQSTIKTRSSKQGVDEHFNEILFEDKKDAEFIAVQAQKDLKVTVENDRTTSVLHDETNTIKNNRTTTIQEGNESLTVSKGNRTLAVDTGNETHTVKGTRDLTVTGNETHTDKADFTHKVTGNYLLEVSGDLTIKVTGKIAITGSDTWTAKSTGDFTNESSANLTNKASESLTNQAGTSLTNKAGTDLTNQAGTGLTNKAGTALSNQGLTVESKASASGTVDGGGMLTVKGGMVKIN